MKKWGLRVFPLKFKRGTEGSMDSKKKKRRIKGDNVLPFVLPRKPLVKSEAEDVNGPCEMPDEAIPMGGLAAIPGRSDDTYLEWVAGKVCCAPGCRSHKTVAHHWPAKGKGGRNGDDRMTVPLCSDHHDFWHDHAHLPPFDNAGTKALFREIQMRLVLLYLDTECTWP